MTCDEFLTAHSEYLDGRMEELLAERCRSHVARCGECARYDRVVRAGLEIVRGLEVMRPSADFSERLSRRLWAEHARPEGRSLLAAAAVSFAAAGAIALVAWSPLLRQNAESTPARTAIVEEAGAAGRATGAAAAGSSIGEPAPWWAGASVSAALLGDGRPRLSDLSVTFPGPYSPLTIDPPLLEQPVFVRFASQQD